MEIIYNTATDYFNNGKYYEAIDLYAKLEPTDQILYSIATCYKNTNRLEDMLKSQKMFCELMEKKLRNKQLSDSIKENFVHVNLCLLKYYSDNAKMPEAIKIATECLKVVPNDARMVYNLGHLYLCMGRNDDALKQFIKAQKLDSTCEDVYLDLICLYKDDNKYDEAINIAKLGITKIKNVLKLYNELGVIYSDLYQTDKAINMFKKCTTLSAFKHVSNETKNIVSKIYANMGHVDSIMGNFKEGLKKYELAIATDPTNMVATQNYLMDLLYVPFGDMQSVDSPDTVNYQYILKKHFELGSVVGKYEKVCNNDAIQTNYDNLTIHIGFVSGDFCGNHPMTYFLKALLNEYNSDKFVVYCYSTSRFINSSDYSPYIKWRYIKYLSTLEDIQVITNDKIDILFDLSGHTSGNKQNIFANRVAKYQISYLGYPCITGIPNIDYYLIDNTFNYTGSKILTMPHCFTHYTPRKIPNNLIQPYNKNGYITFCSLNKVTKFNECVVELWDKILDTFKDARLLIKKNDIYTFRNKDRVDMIDRTTSYDNYIEQYNLCDIALDTFPYAGTTTTCESLLMGTPVVSLADRVTKAIHQNTTASLLINSNLSHLIAETKDQYISIIGSEIDKIKQNVDYKQTIQKAFITGNVMNSKQYVSDFETLMQNLMHKI
jgi:predicted O-linked N-acetylglucosamine transferase (SPINDLY family)